MQTKALSAENFASFAPLREAPLHGTSLNFERNQMKTRIVTLAAFMIGCVNLASGCHHNRGCVGGSCYGGSCNAPSYGATASPPVSYPSSYPSSGSYSPQETYTPSGSGGSGTRSAPVFQGSGSR